MPIRINKKVVIYKNNGGEFKAIIDVENPNSKYVETTELGEVVRIFSLEKFLDRTPHLTVIKHGLENASSKLDECSMKFLQEAVDYLILAGVTAGMRLQLSKKS